MRRSSIIYALLTLAVVKAQSGYDYNPPSKPFNQSSTTRPGEFPVTAPGTYPGGQPNAGGGSPAFTNELQSAGYPGPNSTPIVSSSLNQGYPGTVPSGYPQGQPPSQPEYPGQGTAYPAQGGYEQNRPSTTGIYPRPSPGQSGVYPTQSSGQTFPGQNVGQNYPGQGSGQNYQGPNPGQNYPGPNPELNYPGAGNGQNFQGQITSGTPSSGVGFVPLGPLNGLENTGAYEGGDYSAIPGEPDRDYPIFTEIPQTSFRCDAQTYPGYYADVETRCQAFHVCANNRTYDFLCPNGTIFSQQVFVCVWWNQFDCNTAPNLFDLNANLYDYSIMGSQGNTEALGEYSQEGPQRPGLSGSNSVQGPPSNIPSNIGSEGSFLGPPGQTSGYPSSIASQKPSNNTPVSSSVPSTGFAPGTSGQRPSSGFTVTQGSSAGYPSNTGSQTSTGYPGGTGTQNNLSEFTGGSNLQRPSVGYPTNAGNAGNTQVSLSGYPTVASQSPVYSDNSGTQAISAGFPNNNVQNQRPVSQRPNIGNNQGYPSGKPSGPNFPPGPNEGRPIGSQNTQPGSGAQTQQPNREYLPPRK